MRNPFKRKSREPGFTGQCLVREFTGDGVYVGPCYYSTYDGVCLRHGNVAQYLEGGRNQGAWPRDFELSKWDGNKWAEALRAEFRERDRTRL